MALVSIALMLIGYLSLHYLDLEVIGYVSLVGSVLLSGYAAVQSSADSLLRRLVFYTICAAIAWWADGRVLAVFFFLYGLFPVAVHWGLKGQSKGHS
jgi:hypothetical protein